MVHRSHRPLHDRLVQNLLSPGRLRVRVEEQMDVGVDEAREEDEGAEVKLRTKLTYFSSACGIA